MSCETGAVMNLVEVPPSMHEVPIESVAVAVKSVGSIAQRAISAMVKSVFKSSFMAWFMPRAAAMMNVWFPFSPADKTDGTIVGTTMTNMSTAMDKRAKLNRTGWRRRETEWR